MMLDMIFGFGAEAHELTSGQVIARSVLIYGVTIALVKFGHKRLFGRASLFDAVVAIMLGSIMSRGVTGASPLLQTIAAGATLITIHWLLASLALRFSSFGPLVKGNPVRLIKEGKIQEEEMENSRLTKHDLEEALRLKVGHEDPSLVKAAYLERNGKISIISYPKEPRVVEATCEGETHQIRIVLE